jgi:undecaprenyl-diphosphatase
VSHERRGSWTRWWFRTPDGRGFHRRRTDIVAAGVGLGVAAVCGILVSAATLKHPETAVFRWINGWPEWLYPPMWFVQLWGVIGVLPAFAVGAALLRRFRLAAALLAATLLKLWVEAAAKGLVQRNRPAQTLSDVVLRGRAAARGLSFPSGHAMVIFAIATLVTPYLRGRWRILPWALAAAVCVSRVYLGAHFPLDVLAGAGLGVAIGGALNLAFGVPSRTATRVRT